MGLCALLLNTAAACANGDIGVVDLSQYCTPYILAKLVNVVEEGIEDVLVELFGIDNGEDDRVDLTKRPGLPSV